MLDLLVAYRVGVLVLGDSKSGKSHSLETNLSRLRQKHNGQKYCVVGVSGNHLV